MPKQTARKCTGGGYAPYALLARAKKAAAATTAAGLPGSGANHADGQGNGDEDEASRDLSVSSAGMEDMKLFSIEELQAKTKEELVQIVVRLQESIQDIIAEEDDEEDFDGAAGADDDGDPHPGDEDEDDIDDEEEDFEDGVAGRGSAAGPPDVVEIGDEDEDDDLDEEDEGEEAVNGIENGDLGPDTANGESKD